MQRIVFTFSFCCCFLYENVVLLHLLGASFGAECSHSEQCAEEDVNSVCDTGTAPGTCVCDTGFVHDAGTGCIVE